MVFILYLSGNHDKSYLHYRSSCYHYGRMTGSFWSLCVTSVNRCGRRIECALLRHVSEFLN